jgi:protein kinase
VDFGLSKHLNLDKNTGYIATRWYRAPECLLSMPYDTGIDVFALGCLMGELYNGRELFRGLNSIDQLNQIFSWLGSPTLQSWPEGMKQMKTKGIGISEKKPRSLINLIPTLPEDGLNLLTKLLTINPSKRIGITEIRQHHYFNTVKSNLPSTVL